MSDRPTDPSQWPPRNPSHPRHTPVEPDPTGVREILSSLRDPGPMPPDLVRRINASLSAEQARREAGWLEATRPERGSAAGHGGVAHQDSLQLDGLQQDGLQQDGHQGGQNAVAAGAGSPESGSVHSFAAAQQRRTTAGRRWPLVAAAASVAVLAGAVVMGILGVMNGGTLTTASHDTASLSSAGGTADGGAVAERSEERGGDESGSDAAAPLEGAATMVAAVPVLSTGAVLTRASLAEHIRAVRDRQDWASDAISEQLASDSPINSVDGAADCLNNALSEPPTGLAERIDAIDFVRYDGEAAGLILVLDEPGGPSRPLTAYLVPVDCGRSTPRLLDDPLPLAS